MLLNKKSDSLIQHKYLPIDLSNDVDYENRKVRGVLSKFDIVDSDRDVVRKGAFLKSISERGPKTSSNRQIKYLLQHDVKTPAGVFIDLYEDEKELVYEGYIEKTAMGDATLERIRIGFYKEHSYGFQYVTGKCEWLKMPYALLNNPMDIKVEIESGMVDVFECKEMNLFEGSIVTFGANSETPILELKSESDREDKIKAVKELYRYLIKNAPNYDYELILRQNYEQELSLIKSLAVQDTKEKTKPNNSMDYLLNNFKLEKNGRETTIGLT